MIGLKFWAESPELLFMNKDIKNKTTTMLNLNMVQIALDFNGKPGPSPWVRITTKNLFEHIL